MTSCMHSLILINTSMECMTCMPIEFGNLIAYLKGAGHQTECAQDAWPVQPRQ